MIIYDETELNKSVSLLRRSEFLAVDTETTPIKDGTVPDLAGISIYGKVGGVGTGFYFPFGHVPMDEGGLFQPQNLDKKFLPHIHTLLQGRKLLFHNAKFDLAVLEQAGISLLEETFYCTMVLSAMLNENGDYSQAAGNGLAEVARKYKIPFDQQDKIKQFSKKVGKDYSRIPPDFLGPYAVEDVRLTYSIFPHLQEDLKEQGMVHLVGREMAFLKTLYVMERRGIAVDLDKCEQFARAAEFRLKEIQSELGFDPGKTHELARQLYLPPPSGLGLPIRERGTSTNEDFPDGVPSAAKPVIEPFASHHPLVATTLEYRGHRKALSTWFLGFPERVGPDGRLHPNYRQAGTRTGRLSCSGPNLQQIPRTTEEERDQGVSKSMVKELFLADPDHVLVEFDYSQIELRLAASYAQDPDLLEVFRGNGDMHQLTADKVGISRHDGKTLNFAIQYGAGKGKIAEMLGIDEESAGDMIRAFWEAYPGLAQVKWTAMAKAEQRGYVRYWTGKRRHFPHGEGTHKAFNSVIQGGAGEIVKSTMLMLVGLPSVLMVNQVHDSVWLQVPVVGFEDLCQQVKNVMEWPGEKFRVPFPVDMKVLAK